MSCNPGQMDYYSQHANPRMPSLNTFHETPEQCYEGVGNGPVLPGTEEVSQIGRTFEVNTCQKSCYNNYQALPQDHSPEAYLTFPVPGYMGAGRCRGHAIVTQQFSMLGVFGKGENPYNCGVDKPMTNNCKNFYSEIIEDITERNKVRDIPGFRSLLQFSQAFQGQLYNKVIGYSHRYSAGAGNVEKKTNNTDENIFYELFKRAKNNQKPYVGIRASGISDHAILVTGAAYINGIQALCVSDPNQRSYDPLSNEPCDNYIRLDSGNPVYVTGGYVRSMSKFDIFSDDDDRIVGYVEAWKNRCIEEKEKSGSCKKEPPLKTNPSI
jgi:hypothetical protein